MADDIVTRENRTIGKSPAAPKAKENREKTVREIGPESEVRGGPEAPADSQPAGDELAVGEQLPASDGAPRGYEGDIGDDERVRLCAYYLWQAAGEPEGCEVEFWEKAQVRIGVETDRLVE